MKLFGRDSSPSLHKMELNNHSRRRFGGSPARFNMSNVFGDPFSLATLGIAVGGWLIAFVSSIVADVAHSYPNFAWWCLAYTFFCIIGVFITVATDSVQTYHVAMVGYLSAGMVFQTSAVNSLIYNAEGSKEAGAAGFILLSMVSIVWIFYFGSQPQSSHRQTIDSFALHKENPASRGSRHMTQSFRPDTVHSTSQAPQMYNSAQLAGFETSSPVTAQPPNRFSQAPHDTSSAFPPAAQTQPQSLQPQQTTSAFGTAEQQPQQSQPAESTVSQPAEYPYRARAIYSYEANPDDPNEISFNKHEVLEVSDVSGRWWQAKKSNGETGIAPSNYLILL